MPLAKLRYHKPIGKKGEIVELTDEEAERYANYIILLGEPESVEDDDSSDESLEEEEVHDLEEEVDEDEDDLTDEGFEALFDDGEPVEVVVLPDDEDDDEAE